MKIIGLIGVKESGKTTSFNILRDLLTAQGKTVDEFMIANKLKVSCAKRLGFMKELFEDQRYKEIPLEYLGIRLFNNISLLNDVAHTFTGKKYWDKSLIYRIQNTLTKHDRLLFKTPRHILQYIGTEILRPILGEDCHVASFKQTADVMIVTDIRFQNELDYFKNNYGKDFVSVYIHNSEAHLKASHEDAHVSEKGVLELSKQADFMVLNEKKGFNILEHQLKSIL